MKSASSGAVITALVTLGAACADDEAGSVPAATVSVDTIGDTVVVTTRGAGEWAAGRTLEPSVSIGTLEGPPETVFGDVAAIAAGPDGSVYVLDRQAAEIRVFDRDGTYLRAVGRRGQGPGEIARPSAIAVSENGRVAARDFSNGRLQVWSADGSETWEWPVVSSSGDSGAGLWIDQRGVAWVHTPGAPDPAVRPTPRVIVRVDSTGAVIDTLPDPEARAAANFAIDGRARVRIPYTSRGEWAVHPDGSLIVTTVDGRGIDVVEPGGGVFRILREVEPVTVGERERTEVRQRTEANMRRFSPDWTWNGPPVPATKARVMYVSAARDGRIWVRAAQPSREVPDPTHDPDDPASSETVWVEPIVFEVYERDGTYLGEVETDIELATRPAPEFVGDFGWGVVADELGLERVVRFDLTGAPPG